MATILRCISHRSICHLWLISYQEKLTLKASNEIDSPNQFLTLFGSSLAQRRKGMLCWWPSTKYLNQLNCFKYSSTSKYFSLNGEDIRLMLWDTAGQEEFDCITRAYYRWNLAKKLFELDHFFYLKLLQRSPGLCPCLLLCGQRVFQMCGQVEEEGGGGVRKHPHGAGHDQAGPPLQGRGGQLWSGEAL